MCLQKRKQKYWLCGEDLTDHKQHQYKYKNQKLLQKFLVVFTCENILQQNVYF